MYIPVEISEYLRSRAMALTSESGKAVSPCLLTQNPHGLDSHTAPERCTLPIHLLDFQIHTTRGLKPTGLFVVVERTNQSSS
jgi:hypothetical protein